MKNIKDQLQSLANRQMPLNTIFEPVFYRIKDQAQKEEFQKLLFSPEIILSDYINDQIKELIKYKNPAKKFSTNELEMQTKNFIGDSNIDEYGVWVYFPWSHRLVHILDRDEFIDLRTSRNQYKITRAEREVLATKKIGVIGLSVGQSVSVTLAMERICGELRLADFDVLELTNLNRIRTGIHNLGLPKVYSVAREIAEIDPFIKVTCFPKGLSEDNMDDFFTGGGKLDLLVEESDGFDIKILSRHKARELRVPVIMEGSDRCVVDVERFDLEPERSILHGLVDHLDITTLKKLKTNEEKIPYMLDMVGLDTSSLRLKASMLEIDQSINTWPQLASSVTMGGGITADVSRRLLLNYYTDSGRYHVDIEELIGNANPAVLPPNEDTVLKAVDVNTLGRSLKMDVKQGQVNLSVEEATQLVEIATTAPSGGNIQPWRWAYHQQSLLLFNAFDLNHTFLGCDNLPSYIALGAALENVVLQAARMGLETKYELFPLKETPELVAAISFFKTNTPLPRLYLADGMGERLTNRKLGERRNIGTETLEKLIKTARQDEGTDLRFFTGDDELETIAELLGELEKIRLLEKTGHRDFVEEIRWTREENDKKRDGVDLRTLDLTNTEKVGMQMVKEPRVAELLNRWNGGGAFKKLTRKSLEAAGAVGILTMRGKSASDYVKGGMVVQRVWLEATLSGIAFQPVSASVFGYARLMRGGGKGLSEEAIKKMWELRPAFEKTFLIPKDSIEIFIFRLSIADQPEVKSLRKPLEEIFSYF